MSTLDTYHRFEGKLLQQHYDEFKSFTRLLLTLSIGGLTFLISFQRIFINPTFDYPYLALLPLLGLLLSSLAGVIVQHQIMTEPLKSLLHAEKLLEEAPQNEEVKEPKRLYRLPSRWLLISYRTQLTFFILSFIFLLIYAWLNISIIFNQFDSKPDFSTNQKATSNQMEIKDSALDTLPKADTTKVKSKIDTVQDSLDQTFQKKSQEQKQSKEDK